MPAGRTPRLAGLPQRVPHLRRRTGVEPDLVAQVAGVPGLRDVDVDARDLGAALGEVAEVRPIRRLAPRGRRASGARSGDGRDPPDTSDDPYVEPRRVQREPAGRGRRRPEELLLSPAGDGPVVDHLAVLVAPRRDDAVDRELRDVARHDSVDQPRGVGPGDLVLVQGGDVDQPGLLANRVVLDVVGVGVDGGREVAGPLAPGHRGVQRRRTRVERRADAQRGSSSMVPDRP